MKARLSRVNKAEINGIMETVTKSVDQLEQASIPSEAAERLSAYIDECLKRPYEINEFRRLAECAFSEDLFEQHFGVIGLRKLAALG
jgi:hypothetical protein